MDMAYCFVTSAPILTCSRLIVQPKPVHEQQTFRQKNIRFSCTAQRQPLVHRDAIVKRLNPKDDSPLEQTPVHQSIPIIGVLLDTFVFRTMTYDLIGKYGRIFRRVNIFSSAYVMVADLGAIRAISIDVENFENKGSWPSVTLDFLGAEELNNLDGKEYTQKLKLVQPFFAHSATHTHLKYMQMSAQSLWGDLANCDFSKTVSLREPVKNHFIRSIVMTTIGDEHKNEQYMTSICSNFKDMTSNQLGIALPGREHPSAAPRRKLISLLCDSIRNRLIGKADTITNVRNNSIENGLSACLAKNEMDMLTIMCCMSDLPVGSSHDYSSEDTREKLESIASSVIFYWSAGGFTMSSALLSAVMKLGFSSSLKSQLQREQIGIVKSKENKSLTTGQLMEQMPLLTSYMEEVLRLYPPAYFYFRRAKNDVNVLGHAIRKGEKIIFDVHAAHRDERFYSEALTFKPERFLKDNMKEGTVTPIASFGVGGGMHQCVGAVMARIGIMSTMALLLREYDFELDQNQSQRFATFPELYPESGVIIKKITKRTDP